MWRRLLPPSTSAVPSPSLRPFSTVSPTHNLLHHLQQKTEKKNRKPKKKRREESPRTRPILRDPSLRNRHLDSILTRDASLRSLLRITHHLFLDSHLPLHRHRRPLLRRRLALLHPLLLSHHHQPKPNHHLSLTPLALSLLRQRRSLLLASLPIRALVVAKLLMISKHHRIPVPKIHHSRHLLGLPHDLRDHVPRFPHLFRLSPDGGHLELADWDPRLAVSQLERDFLADEERVKRTFRFRVPHAGSLRLEEGERRKLEEVTTLPLVSPYSDGWRLNPWSVEAEKYRVGVVHEFLSLTLEKRAWIQEIMEFKEELCLTRGTHEMLRRQGRAFYLAGTEMNWAVFLRDAYGEDGELKEKDPLVLMNDRWRKYAWMTEEEYRREEEEDSGNAAEDVEC